MKWFRDSFKKRVFTFSIVVCAICFWLTIAEVQSSVKLERLRQKMMITRLEKVNIMPSSFPEAIFADTATAFDHEYDIIKK